MPDQRPIVAIVGSTRPQVTKANEQAAKSACKLLGAELAQAGWRIAVYSSKSDFIESDVVSGFFAAVKSASDPALGRSSIVCCFPQGLPFRFPEMDLDEGVFSFNVDPSSDREGSFYRTLAKMDGIVIVGGGYSTLIAGHIVLSRGLPIVAVANFGGAAETIWQHLSMQPTLASQEEVQAMAVWSPRSAKECVDSLVAQHGRFKSKLSAESEKLREMQEKATLWEKHRTDRVAHNVRGIFAALFLAAFLGFLIWGLNSEAPGKTYTAVTILGLCAAGGVGATIRMIAPGWQEPSLWRPPLIGIAVGLVFSLLYLLPQLMGGSSFLSPAREVSLAAKVQFISAIVVAFLAGLAFDYSLSQLLRKAKESGNDLATPRVG